MGYYSCAIQLGDAGIRRSASFVWINGKEVGYNEGAQEPAEYNITEYLKPGKNTIAVNVYKYSDGYYLEDQDYWRLAGIFDDVWLFATPGTHIFDWYATTDLDKTYTDARLDLSMDVKNYSASTVNNFTLRTTLYDSDRKIVKTLISEKFSVLAGNKQTVKISDDIKNPAKWSAEYPNLYTLTFELLNELKKQAALWLDFEEITEGGKFYSYGIGARTYGAIWPDRRPQPEMWQIKKSAQPVTAKLISADKGEVEITNRYLFTNLNALQTEWILQGDGEVISKGVLPVNLEPQKKAVVTFP